MKKKALVSAYILNQFIDQKEQNKAEETSKPPILTQRAISAELPVSIGLINKVIRDLASLHIVEIGIRSFRLVDAERLLVFFATQRELSTDILESYYIPTKNIRDIEAECPDDIHYTAYSGYRMLFDTPPIEYSKVYIYAEDDSEVFERFQDHSPRRSKRKTRSIEPNLIVLKKNPLIQAEKRRVAPLSFIYADIWNSGDWYYIDFIKEIEKRVFAHA